MSETQCGYNERPRALAELRAAGLLLGYSEKDPDGPPPEATLLVNAYMTNGDAPGLPSRLVGDFTPVTPVPDLTASPEGRAFLNGLKEMVVDATD
jgi:hypothetical protein